MFNSSSKSTKMDTLVGQLNELLIDSNLRFELNELNKFELIDQNRTANRESIIKLNKIIPHIKLNLKLNQFNRIQLESIEHNKLDLVSNGQTLNYLKSNEIIKDEFGTCSTCGILKSKCTFIQNGRFCSQICAQTKLKKKLKKKRKQLNKEQLNKEQLIKQQLTKQQPTKEPLTKQQSNQIDLKSSHISIKQSNNNHLLFPSAISEQELIKQLNSFVNTLDPEQILKCWDCEKVKDFVSILPECFEYANLFKDENVDGQSFLLLTQSDLTNLLNIKKAPANKIYHTTCQIRRNQIFLIFKV